MFEAVNNFIAPFKELLLRSSGDLHWRKNLDFEAIHEVIKFEANVPGDRIIACYDLGNSSNISFPQIHRALGAESAQDWQILRRIDLTPRNWVGKLLTPAKFLFQSKDPVSLPGVLDTGHAEAQLKWVLAVDVRNCCIAKIDISAHRAIISPKHMPMIAPFNFECVESQHSTRKRENSTSASSNPSNDWGEFGFGGDRWKQEK